MAIDELAARTRAAGRLEGDAWIAETTLAGEPALLVKPQSYMNLSGEPVSRLLAAKGGGPADLIVIVDDVALPLGRLRVRPEGSDGGHNGLGSLIASLQTDAFTRVRIGVGPAATEAAPDEAAAGRAAERDSLKDFVLADFLPEESERLREVVGLAADAVSCVVDVGVAAAMNRFNGRAV